MIGFAANRDLNAILARLPHRRVRRRAFLKIAGPLLAEQRYVEADEVLRRALVACPRDADLLFSYALSANDRGLHSEALERWKAAKMAAPGNAMCWCGVAANLRGLNAGERARVVIDEALAAFPDDPCVSAEAARISTTLCDFAAAVDYWTKALATGNPHPDWLFSLVDTFLKLGRLDEATKALDLLRAKHPGHPGLHLLENALARERRFHPPPVAPGEAPIEPDVLVKTFESLGDNCEFGLVQRYCYAEPLGLFRFAGSSLENLAKAMARRFEDYGADGDLELFRYEGHTDYDCRSLAYCDFANHTGMHTWQIEPDLLLAREQKKIAYLKKRLISDMETPEKIFVRKGGTSFERAVALFRVMRTYGPVTLLWVEHADADHPPGTVECVEDGLLKGYMSRFAPYGNAHDLDLMCWLKLCCATLALTRSAQGHEPRYRIPQTTIYRMGVHWAFTDHCVASDSTSPAFPTSLTQRLVLASDTRRDDAVLALRFIDTELPPRTLVVFSTWIWIPESFKGSVIDVFFTNIPAGFFSLANLERRATWQRVWASSRVPKDKTQVAVGIRVTGFKDDTIYVGPWRLESGCVPNDWNLETDVGSHAA